MSVCAHACRYHVLFVLGVLCVRLWIPRTFCRSCYVFVGTFSPCLSWVCVVEGGTWGSCTQLLCVCVTYTCCTQSDYPTLWTELSDAVAGGRFVPVGGQSPTHTTHGFYLGVYVCVCTSTCVYVSAVCVRTRVDMCACACVTQDGLRLSTCTSPCLAYPIHTRWDTRRAGVIATSPLAYELCTTGPHAPDGCGDGEVRSGV
jgi:hypothetical protein